jgi:hypothetical protein
MKSTGENRQLGEKPVPMTLCPPQISHMDLTWDRTPGLRGERPVTNRLSHGTAFYVNSIVHLVGLINWLIVKEP